MVLTVYFGIVNSSSVTQECGGQTDVRTDIPIAKAALHCKDILRWAANRTTPTNAGFTGGWSYSLS